jgi:hypothetical protein
VRILHRFRDNRKISERLEWIGESESLKNLNYEITLKSEAEIRHGGEAGSTTAEKSPSASCLDKPAHTAAPFDSHP